MFEVSVPAGCEPPHRPDQPEVTYRVRDLGPPLRLEVWEQLETGDEPLARPGGTSRDVLVAAAERAATDLRRREAVLHAAAVLFAFALAALAAQGLLLAFPG